jgi:ATP-dependent protease HslVU (ClpYQ) peptidase subunit
MTCIIGLEENGRAYVGADSAAGHGWTVRKSRTEKIFRLDPFVIAYTTSFRMGQILHYGLKLPPAKVYDEEYMVGVFVEIVRARFRELGYTRIDSNREEGGSFIVGVQGRVYLIADDFQVQHYKDGIVAGGCGAEYALGAMKALEALPPPERILRSLEIAAYYSGGVTDPFTVIEAN